ncbi:MAG: N-formylglutamate deformylase [Acidiphilium sp.]|jgi:formiminoglutamase
MVEWLSLTRGTAPLLLALPHTGTSIPDEYAEDFRSPWLTRKDADWWIDLLYEIASSPPINASILRTSISRSIIDVNRDPTGASLYPGQATTELCPLTSFDGEPLYQAGREPDATMIAHRTKTYFVPYHAALKGELARLRQLHGAVVLYDGHSIRSIIPRLFSGTLPEFNIGSNDGVTCAPELTAGIVSLCEEAGRSTIVNGRFKGGWTTRHYANPAHGIHGVQMELACRAYLREPLGPVTEATWPPPYDPGFAASTQQILSKILQLCVNFAQAKGAAS